MHTLEFENVTKRYGHETVVDNLTFTVQPGRVTGFLGPNGAGKSTTMKILLDLAKADHGHATIGGTRYRDMADPARVVGVVLEPNAFHPGRSGRNHLRILADGAGIDHPRIDQLLADVELTHAADRHVGGYSLGMRQRLGLAAALLGDPPVLVLDEPGNGLDPQGIRWLRDLLRERATAGATVFVSSHLLATGALSALQQAGTSVRTPTPEQFTEVLTAAGATVHPSIDG
ncbi:MAG TPA: ATP-binding cassette domain-containing protein, partial [Candidatus Limnocylindrales bacterium]|nr:ATP-binding cassette domain-containing protein [Candidatus Limnocylindrales bacterium]